MYKVDIVEYIRFSKVQQIFNALVSEIEEGRLKEESKLPSINQFSEINKVARDTVEKAYRQLRRKGYIASYPGRGYFVLGGCKNQIRVLVIFSELNPYEKEVYESMLMSLKEKATVDLKIHYHSPQHLAEIVEENLGKYDFYVVIPHFFSTANEKEYIDVIKKIPAHELVLLDKKLPALGCPYRAVFQDIKEDVYQALCSSKSYMEKYNGITLVLPKEGCHDLEITEGVKAFCNQVKFDFRVIANLGEEDLHSKTVYIVPDEEGLIKLLKKVKNSGFLPGEDLGIISFNETPFKELLDITVITRDYQQTGQTVAKLILDKECVKYKNSYKLIPRASL